MNNIISLKKLILAAVAIMCCTICILGGSGYVDAATYTDKSGKWTCTIVDETAKTASIKPAKAGVTGVSKGAVTIPNTVVVNNKTYKVTMIAGSAYANNKTITSVKTVSGSSLVQINANAFQNCTALTSVDFSLSNSLTRIYGSAFANCTAVTKFNFKNANLTGVAANAFSKAGKSTTHIWVKNSGSYNKVKASGTLVSVPVAYNYTITYNGNGKTGGTVPAAANAVYTTNFKLSANVLTRTGYTFGGWNTKADGTGTNYKSGQIVKGITATGAITLYAKWTPIRYNVRFMKCFASETGSMADMTLTYDKAAKLNKCTFANPGYIFKGWALRSNRDKVAYTDQANVKNLTTKTEIVYLYSVWEPITYTITFVETEDRTPETVNVKYDENYDTYIPTRTGYIFRGWSKKQDGSTIDYAPKASLTNLTTVNNSNVILYAVWEKKSYTFRFFPYKGYGAKDDPGYTVKGVQPDKKCYYDTAAKLDKCVYKRAGYTFAGWYTELPSKQVLPDGADVTNFIDTSDTIPLYALWEPINYTITFSLENSDDDVIGTAPESIACTYDAEYTIPAYDISQFSKEGYVFAGWVLDDTKNVTEDIRNTVFEPGETYKKNLTTKAGKDVVLVPKWVAFNYRLEYKLGNQVIAPKDFLYGENVTISDVDEQYYKAGYTFDRWNTREDGTGTDFFAGDIIRKKNLNQILKDTKTEDNHVTITLYPKWTANRYKVTLIYNDGEANTSGTIYVTYGSTYNNLKNPTRTGYTFQGWSTDEKQLKVRKSTDRVTILDNVTLYAFWKKNTYKVTYNANGGKINNKSSYVKTYQFEDSANTGFKNGTLPVPKRAGYLFSRWTYKSGTKTYTLMQGTAIKQNVTATAEWTKVKAKKVTAKKTTFNKITRGRNKGKYKVTLTWKCEKADGYEYRYAPTAKKLSNATTFDIRNKKEKILPAIGLQTYAIFEVRSYRYDSTGAKIYSKWTKIYDVGADKVSVTFDANKGKFGSKSTKKVKVVRNQSVATGFLKGKLAALKPKRAGYKLVGWYYIDKDNKKVKVKNSTKIKDKNIVIYAKWKKK